MNGRTVRRRVPTALVPIAVWFVVVLALGLCKVSGSSVAAYGESNRPSAGQVRPVRGDEFLQRTPLVLRQAALGFPTSTDLGMGEHDTGILADLPTGSWAAVLRPQTIGYAFLGVERAFALEWWLVLSAPFLGAYALLVLVTRRVVLSTFAGLAVAVAPAALWWAIPSMGMSVGFATGAAALVVLAGRARSRAGALAAGAGAGWALAGLAGVLYFPWTVPLALLTLPIGLIGWRHGRRDRSAPPRWLWTWGPAAGVALVLTAGFLLQHRVAIQAVQSTVYPGERRSAAGGIDLRLLLAAPFDAFTGSRAVASVDGINQSEVAAGIALWLPVLLAHGMLWSWRRAADHVARCAWWAMTACTVMLAWAVLPVPDLLGRITLLDRVPPERLLLPLSVAGILVAALYASAARADESLTLSSVTPRIVRRRAVVLTAALTAWAGAATTIDGSPISRWWVLVLCLAVGAIAWALLSGRGPVALAAVVALTGFSTLRINPVQIGLGPILDSPLMAQIDEVRAADAADGDDRTGGDERWVLNGNDPDGYGILSASGVPLLSGLSLYPDDATWEILDPADASASVWNRYGRVNVYLTPDDQAPVMGAPYADVIEVSIGACNVELLELHVGVVVSPTPIESPCLAPIGTPPDAADEFWFYRVDAA